METLNVRLIVGCRGATAVARRFGISQSHVSRVLRGIRRPSKELARKLVKIGVWTESQMDAGLAVVERKGKVNGGAV